MNSLYLAAALVTSQGMMLIARYILGPVDDWFWAAMWILAATVSTGACCAFTGDPHGLAVPLTASIMFGVVARVLIPAITSFGAGVLASTICMPSAGLVALHGTVERMQPTAPMWIAYYVAAVLIGCASVAVTLFRLISPIAEFCIRFAKRDAALRVMQTPSPRRTPKVSIHVPCYAEPPYLVIATLDALSRVRYPDFEVLVIDNNTKHPDLWVPVARRCDALGDRFRFFHVDPLSGAKAGAVNFALAHTAGDAEIICVVDADYIAEPDFLERYTPLFEDPRTGFVQTSHDYRDWEASPFLTGVYYDYMVTHKLLQPATNEFDSAFITGTMCLVKREALERAGGWAEWSLTEDSELAVRIHALGYVGHVFRDTAGRGLIPETMEGVKKQQFRWSSGPMQQFMVHWRVYLGYGSRGRLSFLQGMLELNHSFARMPTVLMFVAELVAFPFSLYLICLNSVPTVPDAVWVLLIATGARSYVEKWIAVRRLGASAFSDFALSLLAGAALRWTYISAFIAPMISFKQPWHRTDKFEKCSNLVRAWHCSRTETVVSIAHFIAALSLLPFADFHRFDLVALISLALLLQAFGFLCTLIAAALSEGVLRAKARRGSLPRPLGASDHADFLT
ncbi:glycosyltransferase [Nocardia sp. NPDC051570]|uniref:glycosyltransferase n=1 Tax=Nocardia sp. NPDC051570 TaxID=3364324 RepID=UPI0037B11FF0